jgi:hypothetical protein
VEVFIRNDRDPKEFMRRAKLLRDQEEAHYQEELNNPVTQAGPPLSSPPTGPGTS